MLLSRIARVAYEVGDECFAACENQLSVVSGILKIIARSDMWEKSKAAAACCRTPTLLLVMGAGDW